MFDHIRGLIEKNELRAAARMLKEIVDSSQSLDANPLKKRLINVNRKARSIEVAHEQQTRSSDSLEIESSQLTLALLHLLEDVEQEFSEGKESAQTTTSTARHPSKYTVVSYGGQVYLGDDMSKDQRQDIKIGDGATVGGSVGVQVQAKEIKDSLNNTVSDSFNTLQSADMEKNTKELLDELLKVVSSVNEQIFDGVESSDQGDSKDRNQDSEKDHSKIENAKKMTKNTKRLVEEASGEEPERAWYELSIKGLEEAAIALGKIAKPVLNIVGMLKPLLLG